MVYVGKGQGNRYLRTDRNIYFRRTFDKYNLKSIIIKDNLTEELAFQLERKHIEFWKKRKQAKTNLHEGGYGGDVFKYYPEGKKRMIEKTRLASLGENNAMYGVSWHEFASPETIENHRVNCGIGQKERYKDPKAREHASKMTAEMWQREGHKEEYSFNNGRRWHQYDINGNYIQTFIGQEAVLNSLGMKNHMTIDKNERLRKPYKGYYWLREKEKGVETIEKENNYFHLVE